MSDRAIRLFIGARISLASVRALDEAVQAMRRAGSSASLRCVAPASYHITLKFLGWARPEVAFALRDRMATELVGQRGFELETCGLGAFPSLERARVLWAGVDRQGGARLGELAARAERVAEELGFAREQRPFHAHVTLARLKVPGDVRGLVSACTAQVFRISWVDSVVLFESHMKSSGSEYEEKARWALEGDSKASRRHTGPVETETELDGELPLDEAPDDDLTPEAEGPHQNSVPSADEEQHDDGDQY